MDQGDDAQAWEVVFDPARVSRAQSWSPGLTLPFIGLVWLIVAVWEPWLWWVAVVVIAGIVVLWLWEPVGFWVLGRAPLIEVSATRLRVTSRGRTRTEELAHFLRADVDAGAGWVFTRDPTFAFIRFVWEPTAAPRVEDFPPEPWWHVSLPLRGRDRRQRVLGIATALSERGLPSSVVD